MCQWTIASVRGHSVLRNVLQTIMDRIKANRMVIDATLPNFVHVRALELGAA